MLGKGNHLVDPKELPLRWLFLDLNSYFASVEQAENPEWRGKPLAVAPADGNGATIIAASYEAKAFGVKTGTKVGDAKQMCPGIIFADARHTLYVHYHDQVLEAVDSVVPIDKVCSIDELRVRLLGEERTREGAIELAKRLKAVICDKVSPILTSSIGIAPNSYLAKVGTELMKPDGLVVIESQDLPSALLNLELKGFPGINQRMEARLMGAGIFCTQDLVEADIQALTRGFGGKLMAERWWHLLRGYDLDFEAGSNKSLGHSHVLSPQLRNDGGAREIMKRLVYKACSRLRTSGFWAEHAHFHVQDRDRPWQFDCALPPTQDALTVLEYLESRWAKHRFDHPIKAGVTFTKLKRTNEVTLSLFDEVQERANLGHALDGLNAKFGKHTVYAASLTRAKDHAGERIAFQKTTLLSEGKGDNIWKGDKKTDNSNA